MKVCATISVLDFGSILATGTPAQIQKDQAVLEAYLGTTHEH
jgi:branched-chain amino acid transport system ATP-binding protein